MSTFTIIGAGQSGLLLGIGLRRRGHEVTIVTNRRPDEIRNGRLMSSNCLFGTAYEIEKELEVDFWAGEFPAIEEIRITVAGPDGNPALAWRARLDKPGQAVDQRVKYPRFMAHFEELGGRIEYCHATVDKLETYATDSDLVIVATGKSDISQLFASQNDWCPYQAPQRRLVVMGVRGLDADGECEGVSFDALPGLGECFIVPGYNEGTFHHVFFEALIGTPLDEIWQGLNSADEYLATAHRALKTWVPWQVERCRDMTLVDDNAYLHGQLTPAVRSPVAKLPSGAPVLGLADALVLNDPLLGQGTNNATKSAATYLRCIEQCEDGVFDEAFMQSTFATAWEYSQWPTRWTNEMLKAPMPAPMQQLIGLSAQDAGVAHTLANCFDRPEQIVPRLMDPEELRALGVQLPA